jgi:hypothetical protein
MQFFHVLEKHSAVMLWGSAFIQKSNNTLFKYNEVQNIVEYE